MSNSSKLYLALIFEMVQRDLCKVFLPPSVRLILIPWEKAGQLLVVHVDEDALLLLIGVGGPEPAA